MLTRIKLRMLQLRLWANGLLHIRRERYRKRYYEIMKKPMSKMTIQDREDFRKIYNYFQGDIDNI